MVIKNTFKKTNDQYVYNLKGNDLNSHIILDEYGFYLQVNPNEFVKMKKVSSEINLYGEPTYIKDN